MTRWRILIADDEALMAQGLKLFIELADDLEVVGLASDGLDAVHLCTRLAPHVVLMDLSMPVLDGVAATRRIRAEHPAVRIVIVTTFATAQAVVPALRAGADGYLLKDSRPEELVAAVHDVIAGRNPLSPQITGALLDEIRRHPAPGDPVAPLLNPDVPTLTERDREVLDLLAQGLTNVEMARELVITEAAVKSRLTQLTGKFGVASRVQLLVRACELGVVQPRLR